MGSFRPAPQRAENFNENQEKLAKNEKKDLENSNLSGRSATEINFLEKKGVLDWDSDSSHRSEGEKIKRNRENFLEELNKNLQKIEDSVPKKPEAKKVDESFEQSQEKLAKKLEKQASVQKLEEEKKRKAGELSDLSKREKTLEKKLDELNKAISNKAQEIKTLDSEENRKNKILYDKDKEILKKMQELKDLEAKFKAFSEKSKEKAQNSANILPLMDTSREPKEIFSDLEDEKIKKLQRIARKLLCFFYLERDKRNKILMKAKGVLFPCLEKNKYTRSLLKNQRKCDLLVYFEKPTRLLHYILLVKQPKICIFQHCVDLQAIFKDKTKLSEEIVENSFKNFMNELFGCLILLENKRLCVESFLLVNQTAKALNLTEKIELFYVNPLNSRLKFREIVEKKGPDSVELQSQIDLNRQKLEEMKRFEELARLEEERKALEKELIAKKEAKLQELKLLEEMKKKEEKDAEIASFLLIFY